MTSTVDIQLKAEALQRHGLPDITYPIPVIYLEQLLSDGGELPLGLLLHGLQQKSQAGNADWQKLEPAMTRLAELLAPADDQREALVAMGDNWWLEIGSVDLLGKIVTIQRQSCLVAAIAPREDGRLRIAVFRPLDAKSAEYLLSLSQNPDPVHGVCMRENNWEYALDCSAGMGNTYAAEAGEAYLSYWEKGLGISWDGSELPEWRAQLRQTPRRPALAAIELGIHYTIPDDAENTEANEQDSSPEISAEPEIPGWSSKRQQSRTVRNRFLGCLLGGAVGDALGAAVEFMSRAEILRQFGTRGLTDYTPAYGGLGRITDDTQMTLFTAEGLLRGWVRGCLKGITSYPGVTAHAYLRWLRTQGERQGFDSGMGTATDGWLFQIPALHSRRAPGNTCLTALRQMTVGGEPARNDSKGCGGVMRVAPVGLFAWRMGKQKAVWDAFKIGTELAAITHGHPTGSLTGGVLAVLVLALTDGASLPEALATAKVILRNEREHEETLHALEQAEALAATELPHHEAITRLGQGWIAEEALAISVYCALVAKNFKYGVLLAVNHDGDSDSTGSITGNLLGAMLGVKAIPTQWLAQLELREVIEEIATDLYDFPDWGLYTDCEDQELVDRIWKKYPGC